MQENNPHEIIYATLISQKFSGQKKKHKFNVFNISLSFFLVIVT